jgi:uncharacterized protein with ATP-grasp and redox domains
MNDTDKRDLEELNVQATEPTRTAAQSAAQTTTNDYADIDESELDITRAEAVTYIVENTGDNAIDARIVGAIEDEEGNLSAYAPAGVEETSIASDGVAALQLDATSKAYDKTRVQVKSNSGGSHGDAEVHGMALKR